MTRTPDSSVPAAKQRSIPLYFAAFCTAPCFLNRLYCFLHHFSPRQDFQTAACQYASPLAISRALYWTQTSNLSEVYRKFIKETKRKLKKKTWGFLSLMFLVLFRAQVFKTFLNTETLPTCRIDIFEVPSDYYRGRKYSRVSSHHRKTSAQPADSLRSIPPHTYVLGFTVCLGLPQFDSSIFTFSFRIFHRWIN